MQLDGDGATMQADARLATRTADGHHPAIARTLQENPKSR